MTHIRTGPSLDDVPLGLAPDHESVPPVSTTGQAIVIGAGIGGLLVSRVLADSYDKVLILERDSLPNVGEHRKGIPQGRHVHGLMARGRSIIEELFPGITDELISLGAIPANIGKDMLWYQNGGYHCETGSETRTLLVGRPTLEGQIRMRLLERNNVSIKERCAVHALVMDDTGSAVIGVRATAGGREEIFNADLVVDSSGRGSQLPAWLRNAGYDAPVETRVGVVVRYATRLFKRSPGQMRGKYGAVIVASPELKRGSVTIAQEGDRWLVTLAGRGGEQPPNDLPGFTEYARSLAAPDVHQLILAAEPLDDGAVYGFPQSQRRYYEQLDAFPTGLLAFGDAICAFNPVYAQGMTVAALEALCLQRCLADGTGQLANRFFKLIAQPVDAAWRMAASGDLRFSKGEYRPPRKVRAMNWYMDRFQVAARNEPAVAAAFVEVVNFNQPPSTLTIPRIALRVLRGNLRENVRLVTARIPRLTRPERRSSRTGELSRN
jgi:2-polyprenyl-6-methoxyphenol hydroxylase-like FAD-dependent oxidoreductase